MRIAGVDIGGTSIKIGIFEDDALIEKTSITTPFSDPDGVCDAIAKYLNQKRICLLGVGTAGSVDILHETVSASNLGWEGVPLRKMLSSRLGVPVWIDNDAQTAAIAECHDGVCKDARCALYLTLGTGIGGAMIVEGKPFRGPNNMGAEFGHMIIHPDGERCSCGRRGCLEYYASATGLKRMAGGTSAYDVIQGAKRGDIVCRGLFEQYVRELSIGLNNLIMIFDPEVIALGGGISGAGEFLADACQKELERLFGETTDPLYCRLRIAKHQNDAGMLGAALLARDMLQEYA